MGRHCIGPTAMKSRWAILMAVILWLACMSGAHAHSADWGRVTIDHPWALPAKAGSSTKLYLKVTNDEPSTIYFYGVRTDVASETKLQIWTGPGRSGTLESVSVPAGEALDLGTSHFWIALNGLKKDLVAGQTFTATANFGDRRDVELSVLVATGSEGVTDEHPTTKDRDRFKRLRPPIR